MRVGNSGTNDLDQVFCPTRLESLANGQPYTIQGCTTAILIIIEGQLQVFQRFSSSKLVLKTGEGCFMALNHYGNGSTGVHSSRETLKKLKK
jgi:hypothetical protein